MFQKQIKKNNVKIKVENSSNTVYIILLSTKLNKPIQIWIMLTRVLVPGGDKLDLSQPTVKILAMMSIMHLVHRLSISI